MRYEVLVSEYPINIDKAIKLRELGLRVPFIPSDEEFNIYAYIPENLNIKMDRIRAIHYFDSLHSYITQEELDKYDNSIKKFSEVKVGDLVKIKGYKNLVTKVIAVENGKVTTEINLRGYLYRFTEDEERIHKSDLIYQNSERLFQNHLPNKLYVDLANFDVIINDYIYIQTVFYFLIRLKLSYSKLDPVLLNPKFDFHTLFGINAVHGSPALITPRSSDYIFTEDLTLYSAEKNIVTYRSIKNIKHLVTLTDDLFYKITGLHTAKQLTLYKHIKQISKTSRKLINDNKIKQDIIQDYEQTKAYYNITDQDLIKPQTKLSVTAAPTFDIEATFNKLKELNHINILENLDYYLSIIKG